MGLLVRGSEAGFGLYGQRDPAAVLELTRQAQRIAGGTPSVGLAMVQCAQIKALSLLGSHDDARRGLRALIATAPEPSDSPIPAYWTDDQVWFAESWVYAHTGEEARADDARDRVLGFRLLDYQYENNVRLHEALCTVVNGGAETGARQAAAILAELPAVQQTHMINETGRMVLRAVPADKRDHPAVRDLHALTATHPATALT